MQPPQPEPEPSAPKLIGIPAQVLETARGRLADRGLDGELVLSKGELGNDITLAGFYVTLGMVAATEKAGQSPTYALARLALRADLPTEVADNLFLAYNQQSAEEAGHGDKVFGNAYYLMGGAAPATDSSVVGNPGGASGFLTPDEDPKVNKKRLGGIAAFLGGIEVVALNRAFPSIVSICERWDHKIARDLLAQIRDVVRPEESRHVLTWRYVFHHMIAPKGESIIEGYLASTNAGRRAVAGPPLDREAFERALGQSAPTARQLLGKERVAVA